MGFCCVLTTMFLLVVFFLQYSPAQAFCNEALTTNCSICGPGKFYGDSAGVCGCYSCDRYCDHLDTETTLRCSCCWQQLSSDYIPSERQAIFQGAETAALQQKPNEPENSGFTPIAIVFMVLSCVLVLIVVSIIVYIIHRKKRIGRIVKSMTWLRRQRSLSLNSVLTTPPMRKAESKIRSDNDTSAVSVKVEPDTKAVKPTASQPQQPTTSVVNNHYHNHNHYGNNYSKCNTGNVILPPGTSPPIGDTCRDSNSDLHTDFEPSALSVMEPLLQTELTNLSNERDNHGQTQPRPGSAVQVRSINIGNRIVFSRSTSYPYDRRTAGVLWKEAVRMSGNARLSTIQESTFADSRNPHSSLR